ncbi:MAG: hypothetical protein RLZZ106_632 [Cyanobacteriota bacterium]|jgi:hypothetical protein
MPQVSWVTNVHPGHLVRLKDLFHSSLGLQLDPRQSDEQFQLWEQHNLPRQERHRAVQVTLRWKDSRTHRCQISVISEEQDHPESTECWALALKLQRLLQPVKP